MKISKKLRFLLLSLSTGARLPAITRPPPRIGPATWQGDGKSIDRIKDDAARAQLTSSLKWKINNGLHLIEKRKNEYVQKSPIKFVFSFISMVMDLQARPQKIGRFCGISRVPKMFTMATLPFQ